MVKKAKWQVRPRRQLCNRTVSKVTACSAILMDLCDNTPKKSEKSVLLCATPC